MSLNAAIREAHDTIFARAQRAERAAKITVRDLSFTAVHQVSHLWPA